MSGHIARRLAIVAFGWGLLLVIAATALSLLWQRAAFIEDLKTETSAIAQSAINPRSYPTLDELVRTGEHLMRTSDIVGGTFVSGIGTARASFGNPPELSWAEARLEGRRWTLDRHHRVFETFIAPEDLGLGYGLVVQVHAADRWQALLAQLAILATIGLAAAAAMGGAVAAAGRRVVDRRLRPIEAALTAALESPGEAAQRLSRLKGDDEIARLSRRTDRLLMLLSTLINTEVAAAHALVERCPFPLLIIKPDGQIGRANEPALQLFEVASLDNLPGSDGGMLCLFQGDPISPADLLDRGALFGPGEVVLPRQSVPVRLGADRMHASDGTLLGCLVMLIDVRDMVADMRRQVALRQEARGRQRRAEVELARLRAQFEACLVILEHQTGREPQQLPAGVAPAQMIEQWHELAIKRGETTAQGIVHQALPDLHADPDAARRLVHFLLDAVHRRSGQRTPTILVTASQEGPLARLTVRASSASDGALCDDIAADNESTLLLGAIAVLAKSLGGRMAAERIGESGNGITVLLPLAIPGAVREDPPPAAASAA